jgi:hypothetical protein
MSNLVKNIKFDNVLKLKAKTSVAKLEQLAKKCTSKPKSK